MEQMQLQQLRQPAGPSRPSGWTAAPVRALTQAAAILGPWPAQQLQLMRPQVLLAASMDRQLARHLMTHHQPLQDQLGRYLMTHHEPTCDQQLRGQHRCFQQGPMAVPSISISLLQPQLKCSQLQSHLVSRLQAPQALKSSGTTSRCSKGLPCQRVQGQEQEKRQPHSLQALQVLACLGPAPCKHEYAWAALSMLQAQTASIHQHLQQ